jgi:hypothetical protein
LGKKHSRFISKKVQFLTTFIFDNVKNIIILGKLYRVIFGTFWSLFAKHFWPHCRRVKIGHAHSRRWNKTLGGQKGFVGMSKY